MLLASSPGSQIFNFFLFLLPLPESLGTRLACFLHGCVGGGGGQQASCLVAVEFPQVLAHRHRKRGGGGGQGATRPPSFKFGGASPPPPTLPTLYIMKYCSIVDIVLHLCPLTGEGNHIFVVLKNVTPPPKSEHLPTPMWLVFQIHEWALIFHFMNGCSRH